MKVLIKIFILSLSTQLMAQELPKKSDFRPASVEEMNFLVAPEIQEKMKKSTPLIEISVQDKILAQTFAQNFSEQSKHFDQDVKYYFEKKIKEGANKDIIIQYANTMTQSYMSLIAKEIQLEDDIKSDIQKIQENITKKIESHNQKYENISIDALNPEEKEKYILISNQLDKEMDVADQKMKDLLAKSANYNYVLNKGAEFQKRIETLEAQLNYSTLKDLKQNVYAPILFVPTDFSIESYKNELKILSGATECESCDYKTLDKNSLPTSNQHADLENIVEVTKNKSKGGLYFFWGYNRSWHANSDVTFKTSEGEFTIKDAHGEDRPSTIKTWDDFLTYVNPSEFSIPQYNLKIGYMFNDKWGIEAGTDHMKWIFDNKRQYEITGEFSPIVFVENENAQHDWDLVKPVDFNYVKEHGDASWLGFEHSDGYNYVHLGAVFNTNLYRAKNNKFAIDATFGLGGGAMVPKTKVMMHRDEMWQWKGLDNRFHLAGYGGHADARLKFTFWDRISLVGMVRGNVIKIDNALVYTDRDPEARLSHTPIKSVQATVGLEVKIFKKK